MCSVPEDGVHQVVFRGGQLGRWNGGGSMSANVSKDSKGYRIDVRLPTGRTTCIRGKRLGIGQSQAAFRTIAFHVSNLIGAIQTSTHIPNETQVWLQQVGKPLYSKLEKLKLVSTRVENELVIPYLQGYFKLHGQSRKTSSNKVWGRAVFHAERFFPKDMSIREVNTTIAVEFRNWLRLQAGRKPGSTMAAATIGKTCGIISQAFSHAVEAGVIPNNPFSSRSISKSAGGNSLRDHYVDRETVLKVIGNCESAEDRIVLALARFGCLRMPSEVRELRWTDIDWIKRDMNVFSPKTAHHGKASRRVPLFQDLHDLLLREFEAGPVSEYLLPKLRHHPSLSTRILRAVKKAGVTPWDKLLQNLRASGEEDWLRIRHIPQDVARWCGHTPKIMYQHYMRITDADSASNAALLAAVGGGTSGGEELMGVVIPVVTSGVLYGGKQSSPATEATGDDGFMEFAANSSELVTAGGDLRDHLLVDLIGLEPTTSSMPWKRSSN